MKEQWKKQMQEKMADYQESDIEVSWAEIEKLLANNRQQAKVVPMWIRRVAAAAVILLIAGGGYWTLFRHQTGTEADETSITNTIQTPNTPDSIVNPVKPIIEEMVARVTQGVRRPKTVSDTTDVTPLVAEDADTLATVFAETESDHGDGSDDPISEGNGITQNRPRDSAIYPSDLRKKTSSSNRLTAKVYLSNMMAGSSQYNFSSYQELLNPGLPNENGNGKDGSGGKDGTDGPGELGGKDGTESENKTPVYRTVQTSERVHHHQPIRFGFSLRYRINQQWSFESGLTYSRLTEDITNTIDGQATTTEQSLNYIGIPLSASYLLWGNRHFNFYLSAGGLVEKMVKGSLMTQGATNSVSIHPLQISVNGAVGAEFKLTDSFSLYAEPTLNYSFDNGSSIPTLYQEKPMNFNITVGIRFNLKQ